MSYSVLQEKWIPMSDGRKYSLWECLEHAHELERISCASPLETYAVHRFLCAFVMDALQLSNKRERLSLLQKGRFDMNVFQAYVNLCEQEGVNFDLFDEKRPFMQSGYNQKYDLATKPVAIVASELPSGNNHIFLEHRLADDHCLPVDVALRSMLSGYVFCTAAAQGYPSSVNNTPCLYVIIHGTTLFETLVLSSISKKEAGNLAYGKVAWREERDIVPKEEFATIDLLQGMTWQPRRVTLLKGETDCIRRVYFSQGRSFKGNQLWRDPHVPYRLLKDGSYNSIKPQSGRSLWRDLGGLAVSKENRFGRQPQIIAALPEEWPLCRVSVTGLITNNATLVDTVHEEMLIPTTILNDEDRGDTLHRDLDFVEAVCRLIGRTLSEKFPASFCDDLQNNFLADVKGFVFGTYLDKLSQCENDEDFMKLQALVEEQVLRCLQSMFGHLSLRMGFDAKNIILQSVIQKQILNGYYKLRRERNDE